MSESTSHYRHGSFEALEPRLVLSADPITEFYSAEFMADLPTVDQMAVVNTTLPQTTGSFGFDGTGQTVAIIDSGIAWDHYALGGGFGPGNSVVGGWDFAEDDSNPYDDGPAGFHGTHVAGIVASNDEVHRGVAPGVDLVGLRVFGDSGAGELVWIEQALQWVHDHRDSFANPITTVNLSLGVDWNSESPPDWATLEDELRQLRSDGLFVSVAAGNSYAEFQTAGLSYPASSEFVIPVASHGVDGLLSDFSQRDQRVLVAPGESIHSTVPDHLFGGSSNGRFLGATGTSMAAPYVAGASAVLREAMEFMGHRDLNQDRLLEQFRATASSVFDSMTQQSYLRVDLAQAIDAVVGDAHADSASEATDLGRIETGQSFSGVVGRPSDIDTFRFTASQTGTLLLKIDQTHELDAAVSVDGKALRIDGGKAALEVRAGQKYNLAVSTQAGIGHYSISTDMRPSMPVNHLGMISAKLLQNQMAAGETWYQLTASRQGILTTHAYGDVQVDIYDGTADQNHLALARRLGSMVRSDVAVEAGETYLVKVSGHSPFDLKLTNLVTAGGGRLRIAGTSASDTMDLDIDGSVSIVVNSVAYRFNAKWIHSVVVNAGAGSDQLDVRLDASNDNVVVSHNHLSVKNGRLSISAAQFETVRVDSRQGYDQVTFLDSRGADAFASTVEYARMWGDDFDHTGVNFERTLAFSRHGSDQARLSGSAGADRLHASNQSSTLRSDSSATTIRGFDRVSIDGRSGNDHATLRGSSGSDELTMQGKRAELLSAGRQIKTAGFETVVAVSAGGEDRALLRDTAGKDRFSSDPTRSSMVGTGYRNSVLGFTHVIGIASQGGFDEAILYDSVDDDRLTGNPFEVQLAGSGFANAARGFERVSVLADAGGHDHALFVGSQRSESMITRHDATWLAGDNYHVVLRRFEHNEFVGNGGSDHVELMGGPGANSFLIDRQSVTMRGKPGVVTARDVDQISLDGGAGSNSITLRGFAGDDHLSASSMGLLAYLNHMQIAASNFIWLEAHAEDGAQSHQEIAAVDFWYALHGQWD